MPVCIIQRNSLLSFERETSFDSLMNSNDEEVCVNRQCPQVLHVFFLLNNEGM